MKGLGMMHNFLGLQVWKRSYGVFLGQEKYAVDILNKFGILDCKAITTPMESKLKLLCDASLETVDSMMYCQVFG